MNEWKPTAIYQKIADANRAFYSRTAELYDSTETCVSDARLQADLESDLDRILSMLAVSSPAVVTALDACGGSGNVSLKLLKKGVDVTLVDISTELLALFQAKAQAAGFPPKVICSEIASFLQSTDLTFDLITFSSALHHLEDIEGVFGLAFARLAPGGLLFSVFDPTSRDQWRRMTHLLARLDYIWFKLTCQRADLLPSLRRRLSRMMSARNSHQHSLPDLNPTTAGFLAEYHVGRGIDDLSLVNQLQAMGFDIVWHDRYATFRINWMRRIVESLGDNTSFKLLLRKPLVSL